MDEQKFIVCRTRAQSAAERAMNAAESAFDMARFARVMSEVRKEDTARWSADRAFTYSAKAFACAEQARKNATEVATLGGAFFAPSGDPARSVDEIARYFSGETIQRLTDAAELAADDAVRCAENATYDARQAAK